MEPAKKKKTWQAEQAEFVCLETANSFIHTLWWLL